VQCKGDNRLQNSTQSEHGSLDGLIELLTVAIAATRMGKPTGLTYVTVGEEQNALLILIARIYVFDTV
jgi:hypothetical protein